MSELDELLTSIREQEAKNKNVSGWFFRKGSITKTATIGNVVSINEHIEAKTFKPDKLGAAIPGIFVLAMFAMIIVILSKSSIASVAMYVFISFACTILVYRYVYDIFVSEGLNYIITLSKDGIAFDEMFYKWVEIKETAYLRLPVKKSNKTFLVLLFNDNRYDLWELSNFRSFPYSFTIKLASYIEYFKPDSVRRRFG